MGGAAIDIPEGATVASGPKVEKDVVEEIGRNKVGDNTSWLAPRGTPYCRSTHRRWWRGCVLTTVNFRTLWGSY